MSDLTIPGVTSKIDTQKMIDALMEVERQPLKRLQSEQTLGEQRKAAWQGLNRSLSILRDDARLLFGFQNPFSEKVADSSNPAALTATATRQAVDESRRIAVKRVATADRFLSRSLARDFAVPAGDYAFTVGGKEVRFTFRGGTLGEFVDALNRRGGELLHASVVNDTQSSQVLLIESKRTGAANRLVFLDAAATLGMQTGMLERSVSASRELAITERGIAAWSKPLDPSRYRLADGALTLEPGAELKLPLQPPAVLDPRLVLELAVRVERLPEPAVDLATPPPGPAVPDTGVVEFQGVRIQSERSRAPLPEWTPPKPPERVDDPKVLFIEGDGKLLELPAIADGEGFRTVSVPVGELAGTLESLDLRNRNTGRRITVKDIRLVDPTQRGDFAPTNALSEAGDAVLSMDGIEVSRPSNAVDDLLPGVTLTLKAPSATPVELTVHRDAAAIKKQLLEFVGAYNRIITDLDVLTRKDEKVIDEAQYLTDEERKKALENLGLLSGESMLTSMKASLQQIMMNPYPTSRGRELTLLAQLGIATDLRRPGGGIDRTKLRGYLEVDEAKLDAAIAAMPEAVRELFGNDTDGDLVVNAGVAYTMDSLLRPYVQTGGILPSRVAGADAQIVRTKKQITDFQQYLDDKLAELKRKYSLMEGALSTMEQNTQTIKNFNNQNNNNDNP